MTLKCAYCDEAHGERRTLLAHLMKAHGIDERPFQCNECDYVSRTRHGLEAHTLKHGERRFKCEQCNAAFKQRVGLRNHRLLKHTSSEEYRHECAYCHRKFAFSSMLDSHLDTHVEAVFECVECSQHFESAVTLRQHKRNVHSTMPPSRRHGTLRALSEKCTLCDEQLYSVQARALHLRYHSADAHKCDQCRVGFSNKLALALHVKSHADEGPFKCEQCDSVLKSRKSLRNHRRQHGELTHACAHCPKKYSQRVLLLWHQRRQHKNLYTHLCALCPFSSVDVEGLRLHVAQLHHLQCGTCKADFDDEGLLLMHQINKKHEGIKRVNNARQTTRRVASITSRTAEELTCQQCGRTFKTRASTTLHMKVHLRSREPKQKTKLSAAKIEGLCKMRQRACSRSLLTNKKYCDFNSRRKKCLKNANATENAAITPRPVRKSQDANNDDMCSIDDALPSVDITTMIPVEMNANEEFQSMQVDNSNVQQMSDITIEAEKKKEDNIGIPCLQCTHVSIGSFEALAHMKTVHKFNSRSL